MKEITMEAVVANIEKMTAFVDEVLEEAGCPLKKQLQIDVAVDEIFSNISKYAYPEGTGTATLQVEITEDPRTAEVTFIDSGIPFDPMKEMEPDVTLSAEERKIGGLGIYLVQKTMDGMSYEYVDGKNILRICKNIDE